VVVPVARRILDVSPGLATRSRNAAAVLALAASPSIGAAALGEAGADAGFSLPNARRTFYDGDDALLFRLLGPRVTSRADAARSATPPQSPSDARDAER
jgi:hypothetical protein